MSNGSFSIKVSACGNVISDFRKTADEVERIKEIILNASGSLEDTRSYDRVKMNLKRLVAEAENQKNNSLSMGKVLEQITNLYQKTEDGITGHASASENADSGEGETGKYVKDSSWWAKVQEFFGWGTPVEENEIDSIVFDDDGAYGGDQGGPKSEWGFWSEKKELYNIVREYYPDMTDKQIETFLKKLNSEGCGYVAVMNTIFAAYEGREAEFEETFGFPMYYKGDLNYNKMLVDLYSATDNHVSSGGSDTIDFYEDYDPETEGKREDYNYLKYKTGRGTNTLDREYRTQLYLKEKGVDVKITTSIDVDLNNINDLCKDGYVVISYHDGNLQDINGNTVQYIDGGHAMTITGSTSDGRYIVSSWGEKYYIDPNDIIEKDGKTTTMHYEYYQYN